MSVMNVAGLILMKVDMNKIDVLRGDVMKFVGFNLKEPKVNNSYGNILDDLGKECELKVCSVGHGLVFTTKDSTTTTSEVISIDESFSHVLVQTRNSFYTFEK